MCRQLMRKHGSCSVVSIMSSPGASPTKKTAIQRAAVESVTVDLWTIWYAARYGKLARVCSILDRKAVASIDVQEFVRSSSISVFTVAMSWCSDTHGLGQRTRWSALHFACRYGQSDVVEALLQRGANTELTDWVTACNELRQRARHGA